MAEMTRRLQVLIDEERWSRLERQAERRGASVATLVREAIDLAFPDAEPNAAEAAERFLSRPPRHLGDWATARREIEEDLARPAAVPARTGRRVLDGVRRGEVRLDASTELVPEFVHVLLRRGAARDEAVAEAAGVCRQCRLHAFDAPVQTLALKMVRHYRRLGARDALHAATAVAAGLAEIVSTDRVFDTVDEIDRVDPAQLAADLSGRG